MGYHRSDKGSDVEKDGEVKSCVDCGTTKTPLWRSGPAGPKSLCNACGIKNRKKRGSGLGVTKSSEEKRAKKLSTNIQRVASSSNSNNRSYRNQNSSNSDDVKLSQSLKKKLVPLGQEVVFQRSIAERLRRRLGEEEQAAMLLMALSCGYVH